MRPRIAAYFITAASLFASAMYVRAADRRRVEFLEWANSFEMAHAGLTTPWTSRLGVLRSGSDAPLKVAGPLGVLSSGVATPLHPGEVEPVERTASLMKAMGAAGNQAPLALAIDGDTPADDVEIVLDSAASIGIARVVLVFQGDCPLDPMEWFSTGHRTWSRGCHEGVDETRNHEYWVRVNLLFAKAGVKSLNPQQLSLLVPDVSASQFAEVAARCAGCSDEARSLFTEAITVVHPHGTHTVEIGLAPQGSSDVAELRVPAQEPWNSLVAELVAASREGPVRLKTYESRWTGE